MKQRPLLPTPVLMLTGSETVAQVMNVGTGVSVQGVTLGIIRFEQFSTAR